MVLTQEQIKEVIESQINGKMQLLCAGYAWLTNSFDKPEKNISNIVNLELALEDLEKEIKELEKEFKKETGISWKKYIKGGD